VVTPTVAVSARGGGTFTGAAPLDADLDYPDKTGVMYLSGKGTDDAVDWDFMVSTGSQAGVWSTLPVPSNWDMHGFGTLAYGFSTWPGAHTTDRSPRHGAAEAQAPRQVGRFRCIVG
jgi:hypothetical protein